MLKRLDHVRRQMKRVGLGRIVTSAAMRRGLMDFDQSREVVRAIKTVTRPLGVLQRRYTGKSPMSEAEGYYRLDQAPGVDSLLAHCRGLWAQRKERLLADFKPPYAQVITTEHTPNGLACTDPADYEPIVRFIEQPEIINIVAGYMGQVPVISNVALLYTAVHNSIQGPQQFHRDGNHPRQVHVIVLIDDVDEGTGPFTFVPAAASLEIREQIKHQDGRVADAQFENQPQVQCTGPAGTVYFVNPYACFHFGARARVRPRFQLIVSLSCITEGWEATDSLYRTINRHVLDNGSPTRRMLLDL